MAFETSVELSWITWTSSFCVYFGAKRALKPESLAAKWGSSISLKTKSIKTPTVTFDGTHVVVKPKGSGFTVRLYSGTDYANLSRASNGTYSADIPPSVTGTVRVVVMDSHFNTWEHVVRA